MAGPASPSKTKRFGNHEATLLAQSWVGPETCDVIAKSCSLLSENMLQKCEQMMLPYLKCKTYGGASEWICCTHRGMQEACEIGLSV